MTAYLRAAIESVSVASTAFPSVVRAGTGIGLILRPNGDGIYSDWDTVPVGKESWEVVNDASIQGDTNSYLESTTVGNKVTLTFEKVFLPVSVPQYISGLHLEFIINGDVGSSFKIIFRQLGDEVTLSSTLYVPAAWFRSTIFIQNNPLSGRRWHSIDLEQMEIGIEHVSGNSIKCTKVVVCVCTLAAPSHQLKLNKDGIYSEWEVVPNIGTPVSALLSVRTPTGVAFIKSTTTNKRIVLQAENIVLGQRYQIDHVELLLRHYGQGTICPLVCQGGFQFLGPAGPWLLEGNTDETWNNSKILFSNQPLGEGKRWDTASILNTDWGVISQENEEARINQIKLNVATSLIPDVVHRFLPMGSGTISEWNPEAPNTGEQAYVDVNSYNPDDTTYIVGNAEYPYHETRIITFGALSSLNTQWSYVRWASRVSLHPSSPGPAKIAPVLLMDGDLWIGPSFIVNSYVDDWREVALNLWVNPSDGKPWTVSSFSSFQFGIAVLENSVRCSHIYLDCGHLPEQVASIQTLPCSFVEEGLTNIARCTTDYLVWIIDRFEVGRGGFDHDNPQTVFPIDPADNTLADSFYEGEIVKSHFIGKTAYYWVVIPPDAFNEPIGEVLLKARILSSLNGSDVIGSYFSMAKVHFPGSFHNKRSLLVLRLSLIYG